MAGSSNRTGFFKKYSDFVLPPIMFYQCPLSYYIVTKGKRERMRQRKNKEINRYTDFFIHQEKALKSFLVPLQQRDSLHEVHGSSVEKGQ